MNAWSQYRDVFARGFDHSVLLDDPDELILRKAELVLRAMKVKFGHHSISRWASESKDFQDAILGKLKQEREAAPPEASELGAS